MMDRARGKRLGPAIALLLTAVLSALLWYEFRLRNPTVDSNDTFRYLANGLSLLENRHPYVQAPVYSEFNDRLQPRRLVAYPNQLYSLTIGGLIETFSAATGRFVLWPIWIPGIVATALGFCFLYLLFSRFLPEPDVWLGLGLLGFHVLLMASLTRPLSDAVGWCLTMGLFWAAVRPVSPWALGAALGAAVLFRLQLVIFFPFLVVLSLPGAGGRCRWMAGVKAAAAAGAVVLLFEAAMHFYIRIPPGAGYEESFGSATYYLKEWAGFVAQFGSLTRAFGTFVKSATALFLPVGVETIGLALLLSCLVWTRASGDGRRNQARLLWLAAAAGTLLPLLLYASENNPATAGRYQIYSIPLFVLTALVGLNGLASFSGRPLVVAGLKVLLALLTAAGCVRFVQEAAYKRHERAPSLRSIYADLEILPRILAGLDMPADGLYLCKPTLQSFLPDARLVILPDRGAFAEGPRNHEFDGIITIARHKKDWVKPTPVVEDDRGVRFVRVYAGRGENNLLIYKRETAAP
jgi:hypothetical protein